MKKNFDIKKKIKSFFFLLISLFIFMFQGKSLTISALPMDDYQNGIVVEELRLKIPAEFKEIWLKAEKEVWEPWLTIQDGFMGRQIFWDKDKEEALILVNWKNKKLWKNISMEEVNKIQEKYDENIKTSLKVKVNPLKLIYEGELVKEG